MKGFVRLLTIVIFCFGANNALAKLSAKQTTEKLIDALKTVKVATDDKTELSAADLQSNNTNFKELDQYFDFERIVTDTIKPHETKLSASQLGQFKTNFRDLIRLVLYPNAGTYIKKAVYHFKKHVEGKDTADIEIEGEIKEEDVNASIVFHWYGSNKSWRIYDITFDGSSLVKDYQNQFGRIIEKETANGLVKKITDRLNKEKQKQR